MKSNEFLNEGRIRTGVRNTTIPDPSAMGNRAKTYSGDPAGYDFGRQAKYYEMIQSALKNVGQKLDYVGAATYQGGRAYNDPGKGPINLTSFVATCPILVWQKYEGGVAGGGQNRIYVNGEMIKTTAFAAMSPGERVKLLKGAAPISNKQ